MSQIPFAAPSSIRDGNKMGNLELKDLLVADEFNRRLQPISHGCDGRKRSKEIGLTRQQQDEYALSSQQKAVAAIEAGKFKDEIVPVEVQQRRETVLFDTDEYPKANATMEALSKLRPALTAKAQ